MSPVAPDPWGEVILEFAGRQHGLVSRAQLLRAGVPLHILYRRVLRWRLRQVHRGVYQVGPVAAPLWREMAAVLAYDGAAVVSHASAAAARGLIAPLPADAAVDVIVLGRGRSRLPHIRAHRTRPPAAGEVTTWWGIPMTTVARTLLDLATCASPRGLEQAVAAALRQRLVTTADLLALTARHPTHPGSRALAALCRRATPPAFLYSVAEELFLQAARDDGLEEPETNVAVHGFVVDFFWRARNVIVEIDGWTYHSSYAAHCDDRHRDATLTARGFKVLRFPAAQVREDPRRVIRLVREALRG
jgi:very-short-patch-repair endonuclease